MGFDFENTEAYTPSLTSLLPVGNHVVTLRSPTVGHSTNEYPQLELEGVNANGSRRDWIVYGGSGEFGLKKLVGLFKAAGVPLTNADQDENGELTQEAANRLDGKKVGMLIRPRRDDASREQVQGYVPADMLAEGDVPIDTAGLPDPVPADDDIPF